jgi:hypothetical protein
VVDGGVVGAGDVLGGVVGMVVVAGLPPVSTCAASMLTVDPEADAFRCPVTATRMLCDPAGNPCTANTAA